MEPPRKSARIASSEYQEKAQRNRKCPIKYQEKNYKNYEGRTRKKRFDVTKLPLLPLSEVYKRVAPNQLFDISLFSEAHKTMVRSARREVKLVRWDVAFDTVKLDLEFGDDLYSEHVYIVVKILDSWRHSDFSKESKGVLVDGIKTHKKIRFPWSETSEGREHVFAVLSKNRGTMITFMRAVNHVYKHIANIFIIKEHGVVSTRKLFHRSDFPLFNLTKKLRFVVINNDRSALKLSHKNMNFLLNDLDVGYLHCDAEIEEDFQFKGVLKHESMIIKDASWVTFDHVLKSKSQHLCLENTKFGNREANIFLKNWLNQEIHLEALSFESKRGELKSQQVFSGVRGELKYNFGRPSEFKREAIEFNTSKANDLHRSDKKSAAITVNSKSFKFGVWSPEDFEDADEEEEEEEEDD